MRLFYGIVIERFRTLDEDYSEEVFPYSKIEYFADNNDLHDEYENGGMIGISIRPQYCVEKDNPSVFDLDGFNKTVEASKAQLTSKLIKKIQKEFKTKNTPQLYILK